MKTRKQFATIDEYIRAQPEDTRELLETLRLIILEVIPDAEQTISYGIPTLKRNGKYVVYFAGHSNHLSIYPLLSADEKMQKELAPYKQGRGTLRFQKSKPLPRDLIKRVVKLLAEANQARTTKY